MPRTFTVAEAQSLLPQLSELLTRLRSLHRELTASVRSRGVATSSGNGSAAHAAGDAGVRRDYAALLAQIEHLGVVVRDADSGLVDFPSTRAGERILLCWRLGEPAIAHWHAEDSGFSGRQPL